MLALPLGAPETSATASLAALECAAYTDARLSRLVLGAAGGLGHPGLCAWAQPSASQFMTRPAYEPATVEPAVAASAPTRSELHVVHARIAAGGAVDVLGPAEVEVQPAVLRIVARELAFPRQLRSGTPLELVYERRAGAARLIAMRIGQGVAARHAFYFRSQSAGAEGFFARDGKSLEHRFLRYPLAFDLISSKFSAGRRHPILVSVRPHYGVDFAAKPGTAVISIGSGRVLSAAWRGRYGHTIEIEHDGGYVSRYSHLQRFVKEMRAGLKVRKGQVIGYVGTSGMTTGPHLHFALLKNGAYVDPLGQNLPKRSPLDATTLGAFRNATSRVDQAIAAAADLPKAEMVDHHASRLDPRG